VATRKSTARGPVARRRPAPRRDDAVEGGWQARKSALMREAILDAAVRCFVETGYAGTTTALIAEVAGVSRGAMLHHFASKADLVQAAIEHLHHKLVESYAGNIGEITQDLSVDERNRRGLQGYWNYLSSELFAAYHELCIAGRKDPELQRILEASVARFDQEVKAANERLFPEWASKGELFGFAMDMTKFVMEGMAVSQIVGQKEQRIRRMVDYLGDRLEEIFHAEDADSAIHRHSARPAARKPRAKAAGKTAARAAGRKR
jgi:AcrR family transcriptional regulator